MWFLVIQDTDYCLIWAHDREDAKRQAKPFLDGNADWYEVTPIAPKEYHLRALLFSSLLEQRS